MKYMVHIQVLNILAGDHIDFFIPFFVEGFQLPELLQLRFCKIRKVFENDLHV